MRTEDMQERSEHYKSCGVSPCAVPLHVEKYHYHWFIENDIYHLLKHLQLKTCHPYSWVICRATEILITQTWFCFSSQPHEFSIFAWDQWLKSRPFRLPDWTFISKNPLWRWARVSSLYKRTHVSIYFVVNQILHNLAKKSQTYFLFLVYEQRNSDIFWL